MSLNERMIYVQSILKKALESRSSLFNKDKGIVVFHQVAPLMKVKTTNRTYVQHGVEVCQNMPIGSGILKIK